MKQNDFYEVDGCTDFIPVKLIEEHKHMTNTLEVEVVETGFKIFVPSIYSFPKPPEPQKVTVPKFVAEWIEECKSKGVYLCAAMSNDDNKTFYWLDTKEKQDIFARAWGSPPRMRVKHSCNRISSFGSRITPAHAGKTPLVAYS